MDGLPKNEEVFLMDTLYKITFLEDNQVAFVVAKDPEQAQRVIELHLETLDSDEKINRVVHHGPILFLQEDPY